MHKKNLIIIALGLMIMALSSCTVMRRHYTHGFYLSSKGEAGSRPTISSAKKEKTAQPERIKEVEVEKIVSISRLPATDTRSEKDHLIASTKKEWMIVHPSSLGCDTLFLKDGTVIAARVVEISFSQVSFRYCTGADQTQKAIAKKDIDHITYANGTIERFDSASSAITSNGKPARETNGFAIAGFVLSLLFYPALLIAIFTAWVGSALSFSSAIAVAIVVGLIYLLGLVFSIIGMVQISNNQDRYKGMALAIVGLIISLLPLIIIGIASI